MESDARTETKGQRTRRRLLEEAVERFAATGYRETSVAEIARAVGVNPATAYGHFADKEALFLAAVDADASALVRDATTDEDLRLAVDDRLAAFVARLVLSIDDHPLARRVLGGLEPGQATRLLALPALADLEVGLADQIRAGQADGSARADIDADVTAHGLVSIVLAVLLAREQADLGVDPDRAGAVLEVLKAAVRP